MSRNRYILEINPDIAKSIVVFSMVGERGITAAFKIDDLEELNSDYINEHFSDLQDTAYKRGYEDGKDSVVNGCDGCRYKSKQESGCHPCFACARYYKDDFYEPIQKDEIKVGDEVIYNGTTKCLVVRPESNDKYATLIDSNGSHHHACHSECKKTGRHFDIASILKEMQND